MSSFQVGAVGFATISAFFFYAYAPMQIPAGMLFDRYGPRLLISLALMACSIGCVIFTLSSSSMIASLGRFFIGFGSAFSFIGILILVARWFPASQFALYVGIAQLLASVGAISGESPLAIMTAKIGWQTCMYGLAVLGAVLAIAVWLIVQDAPEGAHIQQPKRGTFAKEWARLLKVGRDRQTWWIAIYSFCSWAPITVFAGLWVVPYLQHVYHMSVIEAAQLSALIWLGVGMGSPVVGWLSDKVQNRRWPLFVSMLIGLVASMELLLNQQLSFWSLATILFVIGWAGSGQALSFALVKEHNSPENVGAASGINNLAVVGSGAVLQPVFGLILSWCWDGVHQGTTPVYSADAYNIAMLMLPACYLIGMVVVYGLINETYPPTVKDKTYQ